MAGTSYSKFFWADWASDPGLILCEAGAQGLWVRLLCIAAEAIPIGHVLIRKNGGKFRKPTLRELSEITRFKVDDIKRWIDDLIEHGVPDVLDDGTLVSRRMVRDFDRRTRPAMVAGRASAKGAVRAKDGKFRPRGPTNGNQRVGPTENDSVGPTEKTLSRSEEKETDPTANGRDQPPSTRIQNPLSNSQALDEICRLLKTSLTHDPSRINWPSQLGALVDMGLDLQRHILPAVKNFAQSGGTASRITSLMYFEKQALQMKANDVDRSQFAPANRDGWADRLKGWLSCGYWPARYGPPPFDPACRADPDLIAEAMTIWHGQGDHPREGFCSIRDKFVPWADILQMREGDELALAPKVH